MTDTFSDTSRRSLNLILAPLMWILSSLGMIYAGARSAKDFSDMSANLLVPAGIAFSIWFPIFVGCIAYAYVQAFGRNKDHDIYRQTGWWTAAGFAGVCGWALITAFAPATLVQWASALIFVPTMLCLVKAMLIFNCRKTELNQSEKIMTWLPISLIAGWTSIAIFLNWTPVAYDVIGTSVSLLVPSLIMLVLALLWAIFVVCKSGGNFAYAFPILWGLTFLAVKQLGAGGDVPTIGYAAIAGMGLILAAVLVPKSA